MPSSNLESRLRQVEALLQEYLRRLRNAEEIIARNRQDLLTVRESPNQ